MKTKFCLPTSVAFSFLILLLFVLQGCDKRLAGNCYKGEVVHLNNGSGCFDLIKIVRSVKSGIRENATLAFSNQYIEDAYGKKLKVGDIIYFKIPAYKEYDQPILAICFGPAYIITDGPIELCQ